MNGLTDAVGVDPDGIEFAWQVSDSRRGALQSGYSLVIDTVESGRSRTLWRSGRVSSGEQAFVAYGGARLAGDTAYRFSVESADRSGRSSARSEPFTFVTGLRLEDWSALWLRPGPLPPRPDQYSYLRNTFLLPAGPIGRATAYFAVAHRGELWCNGVLVDTGTSFCYPDEQYVQAVDLTGRLAPGESNAVSFLHHWYGAGQGRPESAPGALLQIAVHYEDGRRHVVGTGRGWREIPAEWDPAPQRNSDGADYVEIVDARRHPAGWSEVGFDDASWQPSVVLGPAVTFPFAGLVAQRTRIGEEAITPQSVRAVGGRSWVADLGRIVAGRPTVTFSQGEVGRKVQMLLGYALDPDGHVSSTHATQGTDMSDTFIESRRVQRFVPFTYLGYRYFEVDDSAETLGKRSIGSLARHCAMARMEPATFSSSNAMLDKVWTMCAHSALYCSQEQFVDTPTREKGQFLWDAANESESVMLCFGDQNLTWQALRDFARSQARYWPDGRLNAVYPNGDGARDFPDFTARYPEWVWRYVEATGDVRSAVALYPVLRRVSDYLWNAVDATTGLVTGPVLSPSEDYNYGYDFATVADTTVNVLAANATARVALVAALAGDTPGEKTQAARSASLVSAINSKLVNSQGLYIDGLRADKTQSQHASQQANALALAYSVVPAEHIAAVASYVVSLGISVQPNHGLELLRALASAGRLSDMLHTLTDPSKPGWAYIVAAGGTFTWETWTPVDALGDSMSHGWGSSALVAVFESLLGIIRKAPGSGGSPRGSPRGSPLFEFSPPPPGILEFAKGSFPSRAGTVSFGWDRRGPGLEIALRMPANCSARLDIPGPASALRESGRRIGHISGVSLDETATTSEQTVLRVGAGDYRFTMES